MSKVISSSYKTKLLIADVSSFQLEIDWEQLKGSIDGVVIRTGFVDTFYGGDINKTDPKFKDNQRGARAAGLGLGYYYYAFGDQPPKLEAKRFILGVGEPNKYESFWLDLEDRGPKFTKKWVTEFLEEIEKLANRPCHIYTDYEWACMHPWISDTRNNYRKLWLAYHWDLDDLELGSTTLGDYIMLQYSQKGRLPGINTPVDLNYFYGTYLDWQNLGLKLNS